MSAILSAALTHPRLPPEMRRDFAEPAALPLLRAEDRLAQEVGRLTQQLNKLRAQYLGEGQKPQAGCRFATVFAGDAEVLAEYEFQSEEAPNYDADSRGAGPGCQASVCILNVLINGKFIDPRDYFADSMVESWEERILEEISE